MNRNQTIAILFFALLTFFLAILGMSATGKPFNYSVDDAYIHLTIARNLAENGVWGFRPEAFCSASSSLLWTVLLAGFYKIGLRTAFLPLILNAAAVIGCLFLAERVFQKNCPKLAPFWQIAMFGLVLALPHLVLLGMEHCLQCLLYLAFWALFSGWVSVRNNQFWLLLLAFLVATIRYEGLFLIAAAVFFCFFEKKWKTGASLAVISALPILAFGWFSIKNGGYFLPNSLMAKANLSELSGSKAIFQNVLKAWHEMPMVFWTTLAVSGGILAFLRNESGFTQKLRTGAWLIFISTFFHASFAKYGQFFRWESGQVSLFLMESSLLFYYFWNSQEHINRARLSIFSILLTVPFLIRAQYAFRGTCQAMVDVRAYYFSLAEFVNKHYPPNALVAVNGIGVVGYETSGPILDVNGLASTEVLKRGLLLPSAGRIGAFFKEKDVKFAVVGPDYVPNEMPENWCLAGRWTFPKGIVADSNELFYAMDSAGCAYLRFCLREFAQSHPQTEFAQPPK